MQHKFGIEKNIGLVEPYNSENKNKDLINLKKNKDFLCIIHFLWLKTAAI